MQNEQQQRLAKLFEAARRLPVAERDQYLDSACDTPQLRTQLLQLLESEQLVADVPLQHDAVLQDVDTDRASTAVDGETTRDDEAASTPPLPRLIGRYQVRRVLGRGAFGSVYLAYDDQLQRLVAIKVPRMEQLAIASDLESYLSEARLVAGLDHTHIVPVYDVGQTDDGRCFVVSKWIEGSDLSQCLQRKRPSPRESAKLIALIAGALDCAHRRGICHRDVKPANILIDERRKPYLADFGLAMKDEDWGKGRGFAGTPAYMSPEQARGEAHLVDGRSDIFSLGVVLYELLTGALPFNASTTRALVRHIKRVAPPPPRGFDDSIPQELERICLKAMSKRVTDRFATAQDMADDLQHFLADLESGGRLATAERTPQPTRIVPKGLRCFDEDDADFFLDLLPGPRDREGLPESIRFWKTRLEQPDADRTFRVGLIYGPSGCGKSSLVKAGLLPRLTEHVVPVFVEATAAETESRLLRRLRKCCPYLSDQLSLVDALAAVRRGQGRPAGQKVIIVLDQFEQWLHARQIQEDAELIEGLRHCDGAHLQCMVMVRDDFWLATSRFMRQLDIPINEQNQRLVDLFDTRHARAVLAKLGQAYNALPGREADLTKSQHDFLHRAVDQLAVDGRVICVRLSLFADMIKGKPWTGETLSRLGGTEGIGVTFLEETFSAPTAPAEHRVHEKAARAVLHSLLPESGADIKGGMRSCDQLLEFSGYQSRPREFADLLRILDSDVRLITPTDPAGLDDQEVLPSPLGKNDRYYQLTHDYLVPSLREWLTLKSKETYRGRAWLRLTERATVWNAKREQRHLPAWWEYLNIGLLTDWRRWSVPQREMMRRAAWLHGVRAVLGLLLLLVLAWTGIEINGRTQARSLVARLVDAEIGNTPDVLQQLQSYRRWAEPLLREEDENAAHLSPEKLRVSMALLPQDSAQLDYLLDHLLQASAAEVPVIVDRLKGHADQLRDRLWDIAVATGEDVGRQRLRAACALAAYDAGSSRWSQIGDAIAAQLVRARPVDMAYWQAALRPASDHLAAPLARASYDSQFGPTQKSIAVDLMLDYAADLPHVLADAIQYADPEKFALIYNVLEHHPEETVKILAPVLSETPSVDWQEPPLAAAWVPPDPAVIQRLKVAGGLIANRFAFCQTLPLSEFLPLCDQLRSSGFRPARVRPFADDGGIAVAAVWKRDGKVWQWQVGDAEAIRDRDDDLGKEEFRPVDVTGFMISNDKGERSPRFAALWLKFSDDRDNQDKGTSEAQHRVWNATGDESETRLLVGLEPESFQRQISELQESQLKRLLRYSVLPTDAGETLISAVLAESNASQKSSVNRGHGYSGDLYPGHLQIDVHMSHVANLLSPTDYYRRQLEDAQAALREAPDNMKARFRRTVAYYYLGRLEEAYEDLLVENTSETVLTHYYRALVLARQGKVKESQEALASFFASNDAREEDKAFAEAVVGCYLGNGAEAMAKLESQIADFAHDGEFLYQAARAFAVATTLAEKDEPETAAVYRERALLLLKQAFAEHDWDYLRLQREPEWASVRQSPAFQEVLHSGRLHEHMTALWEENPHFESRELHGLGPAEHLVGSRQLMAEGFRPVCMSAISHDDQLTTASLWHRPVATEAQKELLARRQANTAAVLLGLGATETVWPFLRHSADPRGRTYAIHQMATLGVDPAILIAELANEGQDISVRRALVLSLGEYDRQQLPDSMRRQLVPRLIELYRTYPDAGLHAACEWLLRQWGQEATLREVTDSLRETEQQLRERNPAEERGWYVTGQGHTMAVIQGGWFLIGSPMSEPGHEQDEVLQRRRINQRYALSSAPVTKKQYLAFRQSRPHQSFNVMDARGIQLAVPTDDSPITGITWYEAAAYCNWLSEQEGIPSDEWCYDPNTNGDYGSGMRSKPNYLALRGYRLPNEAEWEYACRAGAVTRRHYGDTDALLHKYAWYDDSGQTRTSPVGLRKPNDYGLFDMHGNMCTWCQNRHSRYENQKLEDVEDRWPVHDGAYLRVLRGGSFLHYARNISNGRPLR